MKETLQQIRSLQDVNRKLERLQHDAEMLAVDVRNQERLVRQKKRRAEQAHQQRVQAAKEADATQLKIEEAEQEIAHLIVQLNMARHQRELDAVQGGILSHRADIQKWEDEGLAALQSVDELTQEEQRLAEEVRQAEGELARVKDEVAARRAEQESLVAELTAERERIRRQVRPAVLSAYDRLTGRYRSGALAPIKGRVCQGCFTRVTKQTENLLMRGEEIVYCHSCGRMLMLAGNGPLPE